MEEGENKKLIDSFANGVNIFWEEYKKTGDNSKLNGFFKEKTPGLSEVTLAALELLSISKIPKLNLKKYKRPMFVGSGNALNTAKILGEGSDSVIADESTFDSELKSKKVDSIFVISASGEKHSIDIAKKARKKKVDVFLLTCNANAPAIKEIKNKKNVLIFPKNIEPYTYNTSTYLGMVLSKTNENPKEIYNFLKNELSKSIPQDIGKYNSYYLMLPAEFEYVTDMLKIKFLELFGRKLPSAVFTDEFSKHATTVVSANELFIEIGNVSVKNLGFPNIQIPLPKNASHASVIAAGYYLIGQIQNQKPQYFKENIVDYCKRASKIFGQEIKPFG